MENSVTTWSRISDPCYVHSSPNLQESLSHVLAWEVVMGAGLLDSKCSKKTAFYKVLLNSAGSAVSFRYVVRALFNLFIKHSKKFYLRSCHLHPDLAERDWFCSIATAVTRSYPLTVQGSPYALHLGYQALWRMKCYYLSLFSCSSVNCFPGSVGEHLKCVHFL